MDLGELLSGLDPLSRRAVTLVYFEHRSHLDAARLVGVEPEQIGGALGEVFRRVALWVWTTPPAAAPTVTVTPPGPSTPPAAATPSSLTA